MKTILSGLLGSAILVSGISNPYAEEQNTVVVTATRTAQTANESLASVTVITQENIQRSQARDIIDILSNVSGIHVSRTGGTGKATSIFLRGTESDHTLVLINGIRSASATLGRYAWENISLESIEKIEIVRGPKASLYGSDAIGGVIQIFTRANHLPYIKLGGGSHNTKDISMGISGGNNWRYSLNLGANETDGIPVLKKEPDSRGYENKFASLSLNGQFSKDTSLNFNSSYSGGENQLDPDTGNSEFTQGVTSIKLTNRTTRNWSQSLTLGSALDRNKIKSPSTPSNIITRRTSTAWQNDFTFGQNLLTVGADYWEDDVTKDNSGTIDKKIITKAAYAQLQYHISDTNNFSLSSRVDNHNYFGDYDTWHLAWGHNLTNNTKTVLSHGTGFKSPTVNDLFWPAQTDTFFGTTYITEGNPNLRPEESKTTELEFKNNIDNTNASLSFFYTKINNLIEWQSTQTGATEYTYQPENIDAVIIRGAELQYTVKLVNWDIHSSFTVTDAENIKTGRQLDRRPHEKFNLAITKTFNRHNVRGEFNYFSSRNDRNASVQLAKYEIVNLAYHYRFSDNLDLQAKIGNLTDREYVLASSFSGDYNTYGRTYMLSIRYQGL
ncbi:MAG: TonB-dependent receptor [Gammaproteobacteria bacterium]|nr:TonB-dependent receptor [Gammaproteobacteria bacterium]